MAAQRPEARRLLLRGQRLENSKQMKAFTLDAIGLHLLGEYPYKNTDDLVAALNEADPKGKTWERQRLEYHVKKIRGEMLAAQRTPAVRRPAETSPSDADLTEGFGVGEDAPGALDCTLFGGELPEDTAAAELPPPPNPLGGRPIGTTLATSRALKKANAELMDSATRAWAAKSTALAPAGLGARRGLLQGIIDAKTGEYKDKYPGMDLDPPKKAAVSNRVRRNILDPKHRLDDVTNGPTPILAALEDLLVAYIEESAEVGMYMNLAEIARKMADLMHGKEIGDTFADFCAKSRGVTSLRASPPQTSRSSKKQVADAELRRLAETTAAGRGAAAGKGVAGGRGGRGGRGRLSWKAVATELGAQNKDETAALKSRIRELEAAVAAAGGEVEGRLLLMGSRTHSCC